MIRNVSTYGTLRTTRSERLTDRQTAGVTVIKFSEVNEEEREKVKKNSSDWEQKKKKKKNWRRRILLFLIILVSLRIFVVCESERVCSFVCTVQIEHVFICFFCFFFIFY